MDYLLLRMKRKVNLVGDRTFTVSIPRRWAMSHNIQKGDEISILEDEDKLLIRSNTKEKNKTLEVSLETGNQWYVTQVVRALYVAGFDEIKLTYSSREILPKIEEALSLLPGFEIVEFHDNHCMIKSITSGIDEEFDSLLRKIFFLQKSLYESALEDFTRRELDLHRVLSIRNNLHKFSNLYRRTITKNRILPAIQHRSIFIILTRIMMSCNNIYYIYEYLLKLKKLPDLSAPIEYLKKVLLVYQAHYEVFYNKKFSKIAELNQTRLQLINQECVKYLESNKGPSAVVMHYLSEIVRMLVTNGSAIISYHLAY
jgi:phosphate uptake regulator